MFPTLKTGAVVQYPAKRVLRFNTQALRFLDGSEHGKGARYPQYAGFCLESQKFPYAINVPTWKNQVILRAGEIYRHRMVHRFSVEQGAS